MFLNRTQLKELTGYVRPSSHMRWLIGNEYPFEVGADGYPRVLVSLVEKRLGGYIKSAKRNSSPKFSEIRG